MPLTALPVVKPTQQKRSAETQRKILAVVERLIQKGQFDKVNVQEIARQAGCSIGAFYGRFSDKNAALFGFYDVRCEKLEQSAQDILTLDRPSKRALSDILDDFIESIVNLDTEHAHFLRASAVLSGSERAQPFLKRAQMMNANILNLLSLLLEKRGGEFEHPHPRVAAQFVLAIVGSLSREAVLVGEHLAQEQFDCQSFTDELKRAIYGYLGVKQNNALPK